MDLVGLLSAVVALAVFPGGLFAASAAVAVAGSARGAWLSLRTEASIAGAAAALVAAAQVPLPGSLAMTLPSGGAPADVVVAEILVCAAVVLCTPSGWDGWRCTAAAAAVLPLPVLAASAATLSWPTLLTAPQHLVAPSRGLAGGALLCAGPVISGLGMRCPEALARAALPLAVVALSAAVLLVPVGALGAVPAVLAALAILAGTAVYAAGVRAVTAWPLTRRVLAVGAAGLATAAAALTLIGGRA